MRNRKLYRKLMKPASRALALLTGFVLLLSGSAAEEDLDLKDLLNLTDVEDVEFLPPDATMLARDKEWHTPAEDSPVKCSHDVCYWTTPMGYTDEAAVWEVLTAPVTVLDYNQRHQYKVRKYPDKECTEYTGEVTGSSQGVHVLERGEEWTLIEAYSSSTEDSKIKVYAEKFQGYVETSLLKEVEVDQTYGLVIDKQTQRLYVYSEGKVIATLLCSTGFDKKGDAPWHETPAGEFLCISWTGDFYLKDDEGNANMLCRNAIRINDGILIHEVPSIPKTDDEGNVEWSYDRCERYLGEKASHGCIRVQRKQTPEGVNHDWLWKNLSNGNKSGQAFTKVIIWDDKGRTLGYPDDDLLLYYNPKNGKNYHSQPTCIGVRDDLEPLTAFRYGELDEKPYSKLTACPYCAPQPRREEIDVINQKNNR